MKRQVTKIDYIYILNIEDPGDYYFRPEGVLFVDERGHHTLYASDSRHNFLRSVVQKFPLGELREGVLFREHTCRLDDVTHQYEPDFMMVVEDMLPILHRIYQSSPRQLFFLEKYFRPDSRNSFFIP